MRLLPSCQDIRRELVGVRLADSTFGVEILRLLPDVSHFVCHDPCKGVLPNAKANWRRERVGEYGTAVRPVYVAGLGCGRKLDQYVNRVSEKNGADESRARIDNSDMYISKGDERSEYVDHSVGQVARDQTVIYE